MVARCSRNQGPDPGDHHLPAVRVTCKHKAEGGRKMRRQVRRVRENDWNTTKAASLRQRSWKVVMAGKKVPDAYYRERSPAHCLVLQNSDARCAERPSNGSGGGPEVVVAKHRHDTIGRPQPSKGRRQSAGSFHRAYSIMSRQEVPSDQYQVWMCCIHLINDLG